MLCDKVRRSLDQSEAELKQSQLRHLRSLAIIYLTFSFAVVKLTLVLIGRVITFFGLVLRHSIVRVAYCVRSQQNQNSSKEYCALDAICFGDVTAI